MPDLSLRRSVAYLLVPAVLLAVSSYPAAAAPGLAASPAEAPGVVTERGRQPLDLGGAPPATPLWRELDRRASALFAPARADETARPLPFAGSWSSGGWPDARDGSGLRGPIHAKGFKEWWRSAGPATRGWTIALLVFVAGISYYALAED